jgi:acyl-CoA synthetase (NDP forming)
LNEDESTSCITLYIEGIKDGPKFMESARQCTKPIIALKAGTIRPWRCRRSIPYRLTGR